MEIGFGDCELMTFKESFLRLEGRFGYNLMTVRRVKSKEDEKLGGDEMGFTGFLIGDN